jgi:hypothetical protein
VNFLIYLSDSITIGHFEFSEVLVLAVEAFLKVENSFRWLLALLYLE